MLALALSIIRKAAFPSAGLQLLLGAQLIGMAAKIALMLMLTDRAVALNDLPFVDRT